MSVFHLSLQLMLRHKALQLAALASTAVLLATALAAEFGGRHPQTVALDVGLSTLKLVIPLFIVFQVQELFSREFERKYYLLSLAYPISRLNWLIGRCLALTTVFSALLILITTLLALYVNWRTGDIHQSTPISLGVPLWLTVTFFWFDMLSILTLAVFLAVVASTPSFVLIGTIGFMLIARSYSTVLALLASSSGLVDNAETYRSNVGILGYLLPDLGALDIRMVTLYNNMELLPADWPLLLSSVLFYSASFLALSLVIFQRKQLA